MNKKLETIKVQGICNNTLKLSFPDLNNLNDNLNIIDYSLIPKEFITYEISYNNEIYNALDFFDLKKRLNIINVNNKINNYKVKDNLYYFFNDEKQIYSVSILMNEIDFFSFIL